VALQRGSRARTAKLFLVTPGACEHVLSLTGRDNGLGGVVGSVLSMHERLPRVPRDPRSVERLACVAQHMLSAKAPAVFLPLRDCDERSLASALRELVKAPAEPETAPDDEGVVRESTTGLPKLDADV
jgi:hypothetical protein